MDKESVGAGGEGLRGRKEGREFKGLENNQSEKDQCSELAYGANVENI